ncbi:hypothetical protein IKS57_05375, partial [bacterium]|nr:hypothetical protein [bacterium]
MSSEPSSLPSFPIQEETTFNLVVTNNADSTEEPIISNSIVINVTNTTNIKGALSTKYGSSSNNTLNIYSNVTGTTPNSYQFT